MEWIKVEDALPPEGENVIFTAKTKPASKFFIGFRWGMEDPDGEPIGVWFSGETPPDGENIYAGLFDHEIKWWARIDFPPEDE